MTISHGHARPDDGRRQALWHAQEHQGRGRAGSVEVGGSVFVVLTVTDSAGNPVKNVQPGPAATDPIVPAQGENPVTTSQDTDGAGSAVQRQQGPEGHCGRYDERCLEGQGRHPVLWSVRCGCRNPRCHSAWAWEVYFDRYRRQRSVCRPGESYAGHRRDHGQRGFGPPVHTLNFELDKLTASAKVTVAAGPASIRERCSRVRRPAERHDDHGDGA